MEQKKTVLENATHLELDWSVSNFPAKSIWNTGSFHIHNFVWVVTMCRKHRFALFGVENPAKHSSDCFIEQSIIFQRLFFMVNCNRCKKKKKKRQNDVCAPENRVHMQSTVRKPRDRLQKTLKYSHSYGYVTGLKAESSMCLFAENTLRLAVVSTSIYAY